MPTERGSIRLPATVSARRTGLPSLSVTSLIDDRFSLGCQEAPQLAEHFFRLFFLKEVSAALPSAFH
jgi:hypothetical protein